MYKVRIADFEDILKNKESWNELVHRMRLPSVFCTWEWMSLWWKHYGKPYRPLVLLISKQDELKGILPLASRTMIIEDAVLPVRTIILWSSTDLYPDHLDIIASQEDAQPCMNAALVFLQNNYTRWDVLYFACIDEDSTIFRELERVNRSINVDLQKVSISPYIAIEKDYMTEIEDYKKFLGKKARLELKRRGRKLFESFGIIYLSSNPWDDSMAIEKLFALHKLRAQRKGIKSTFGGSKLLSFHTEVAETFSNKGWLRLRFLCKGSEPIAASYGYEFEGQWCLYQSGLDPKWESMGIGSVLRYEAIKEAFQMKLKEFDFLRGAEEYKNTWTNRAREQYDLRVYNETLLGTFFKGTCRARSSVKRIIQKNG